MRGMVGSSQTELDVFGGQVVGTRSSPIVVRRPSGRRWPLAGLTGALAVLAVMAGAAGADPGDDVDGGG